MREKVSILIEVIPKYGEILIGVGCVLLEEKNDILESSNAKRELKDFIIEEAPKYRSLMGLSISPEFQRIMYKYTRKVIGIGAVTGNMYKDKTVDILLLDLFITTLWPIIVEKYIDNIYQGADTVIIPIKIKKSEYEKIYGNNTNLLFSEIKEFFLCNAMVVSKSVIEANGDMLLDLIIPMSPHRKIDF